MESNTKPEIESEIKVSNEKGGGNKPEKDFFVNNNDRNFGLIPA
jgi:hypothetical protein